MSRLFVCLLLLIASGASAQSTPDSTWRPLDVMEVAIPPSKNATANTNKQAAIAAAVAALPANGGIVALDCGVWRKDAELVVTKPVKFWAPQRCVTVLERTNGANGAAAITFRNTTGAGVFGLALASDGAGIKTTPADCNLQFDNVDLIEVEGNDISGAPGAGAHIRFSSNVFVSGNYVHHTFKDHIHHTAETRSSWVWENKFLNGPPSNARARKSARSWTFCAAHGCVKLVEVRT